MRKCKCPACGNEYTREDNLKRHWKQKHSEIPFPEETKPTKPLYQCSECGKTFRLQSRWQEHQAIHQQIPPSPPSRITWSCPICGQGDLEGIAALLEHEEDHGGNQPGPSRPCSGFREDPVSVPVDLDKVFDCDEDELECIRDNWKQIRTSKREGKFNDVFIWRVDEQPLNEMIKAIFLRQTTAVKVNMAFGFILRNEETGELRFFYPSQNGYIFDSPTLISNENDLAALLDRLAQTDWLEYIRQQKPNSKWSVSIATNVAFFIYKLLDQPIGSGGHLPDYIANNRGLDALEKDSNSGRLFNDHLCYFRCLARHKGCGLKNLEKKTKQLASEYFSTLNNPGKFAGVTLQDLARLDRHFQIHTFVYSMEHEVRKNGTTKDIVKLIHRPTKVLEKAESEGALKLNLFNGHFSFIKDMKCYSKCYKCERCDKSFKKEFKLSRHARGCEACVRYEYPGGVYVPRKNIFDTIEEEGIQVEEDLKFSKYMATFDIEVFYPSEAVLPEKRAKLEYKSEHSLLSVSVCSNVPDFDQPRCFIIGGPEMEDAKELVANFVSYLQDIGIKASQLEAVRYAKLKRSIEDALQPDSALGEDPRHTHSSSRGSPSLHTDEVDQSVGDEPTGFDRESEEESKEEETEEDHQFIDDDSLTGEKEEDLSFNQFVNQQSAESAHQQPSLPPAESSKQKKTKKTKAEKLIDALNVHISELPVVGFNSGKYDLNVLKEVLIPHLVTNGGIQFTIKKNHSYLALRAGNLKFIDVSNFLAAGSSYAGFLKAYECQKEKGSFPYEWLDSLDKLEYPQLPPHSAFKSWLKKGNISTEEYAALQTAWKKEGMECMKDLLRWYNNLDVGPFIEALQKMVDFWKSHHIDMLKDAVSLPGLAMKFEMNFLKEKGLHLSTFHTETLYKLFRANMVGGPAIIFKRYAEAEKTNIRNNPDKPVKKIIGYDANGLYLWALCQPMPVGLYTHWQYPDQDSNNDLKSTFPWRTADEWLAWAGNQHGVVLRTRLNDTEKRLGDRQLCVDGYDANSSTVFEFNGCYWHGCSVCYDADCTHPTRGKTFGYWREQMQAKIDYLQKIEYQTVVKWECDWKEESTNEDIQRFLNRHFPGRAQRCLPKTTDQLLENVKDGTFFGAVEVDIEVPPELRDKFKEMTPIFKNTEISLNDIGPHMEKFGKARGCMPSPRRSLIGSYWAKKILLATPLLKFYLLEGMVVSKVHQAVEWVHEACFGSFGDFVSTSRREADLPGGSTILGETAKTVGNAGYGRFLMDVTRHLDVCYENDEEKVARTINSFFFRDLDELPEGVFEIKSSKKKAKLDLPIQVGFFVYQYAKLRMLQFYYHFIDHFCERTEFEYLEMDTDSAYMALSGDSIEAVVKADLHDSFQKTKCNWLPRTDTVEHAMEDKRTPGLFKVEWEGQGFVGLNSKTYCCWSSNEQKLSSKGISKATNAVKKENYLRVLRTGISEEGENRGFRIVNNKVLTYSQFKTGFNYFYPKRIVLEDGITTIPLEI